MDRIMNEKEGRKRRRKIKSGEGGRENDEGRS